MRLHLLLVMGLVVGCEAEEPPADGSSSALADVQKSGMDVSLDAPRDINRVTESSSDQATEALQDISGQTQSKIERLSGLNVVPIGLAVDNNYIYFTRANYVAGVTLSRWPLNGSSTTEPEVIADWDGSDTYRNITIDDHYVYLANEKEVLRWTKATRSVERYPLGDTFNRPAMVMDGTSLYVVGYSCSAVARVERRSGEVKLINLFEKPLPGEYCALAQDETTVYLGSSLQSTIYSWRKGSDEVKPLIEIGTSNAYPGGIVIVAQDIYWLLNNRNLGLRETKLFKAPKTSGEPELVTEIRSGGWGEIEYDETRGRLYWIDQNSLHSKIYMYAIETNELSVFADDLPVSGGMTSDESYVYWGEKGDNPGIAKKAK